MKKSFTIICILLLLMSGKSWSQDSEEEEGFEGKNLKSMHANADWFKLMNTPEANIFEVKKAYDTYFLTNSFVKSKETRAYQFWTRHIVRSNYDANGNVGRQNKNTDDLKKKSNTKRTQGVTANWSRINVTPDMVPNWGAGSYTQGTCNMLAINPSDSNQMIAAFIDGGTLWRTTDNCVSWTQVATNLLARHFGAVVYSKSNSSIVYAASTQGVLKSTDGGATWAMTSYNTTANYPGGNEIWTMEVKADDPNTVLFGISNCLYKTVDGGASWTSVTFANGVRDLRALPSTPNVVLATVKNGSWWEVRRSTDFGTSWTSITNGYPTSINGYTTELALLAVSPAAPNNVWVHLICKQTATATSKTYDIYKSTDGGVSFSRMNVTADLTDEFWQGGWNQAFGISDTDPNLMAAGAYEMYVSTNGGTSWTKSPNSNSKTGPHSDVHGIVIKGTAIYSVGDGGIFKSTDNGATYDHTVDNGIQSQCIWGFDQGWKSDIMAIGMYHGPTTLRDDSIYTGWYVLSGADAGEAFVNKGDDRYIYAHPWGNARFTRSTNRMTTPVNTSIAQIYKGKNDMNDPDYYEQVYGTNGGKLYVSKTNASGFEEGKTFQTNLDDYIVALTNNKIIYARTGNTINKTVDGGVTWIDVSPSSISAGQTISHIAVDGSNPSVIWVTFGEKQSTVKVGKSTDGGVTWTNYSGTALPSYAVNCIVSQMGTAGGVYIGTDAGVYYRDNSLSDWTAFSTNLPVATQVGWIKINYAKAKLRIAGQTGIWESDLYSPSAPVAHPSTPSFVVEVGKPVQFVDMSVCLANATYSWSFPGGTPSTSTIEKPVVTYATGGDKSVSLTVTDANGTNFRTYTDFVRVRTVGDVAKTGWTVTYYDSQETASESTPATNAIDGNYNTFWGTNWSSTNPPYPHEIRIDMGATIAIESFKYQGQLSNSNGDVKGYEWYVSTDGTNWGTAVATGNYDSVFGEKIVTLSQPVTARYFKFKALSQQTGTNWCKASEIGINGSTGLISAFTANKTLVMPGGTINFSDKSAGNPTSWSWSFPGGTPSTSTAQNPTVTYSTEGIYPVTLSVTGPSGTDIVTKSSYINVGTFVPQTGWSLKYADSEETSSEKTPATNAFDGSNSTFWGTNWSSTNPSPPHEIQIDMGTNYNVNGFNYVPRQNNPNGRIANYEFYVSTDGINWTLTNSGTWANDAVEKSLSFAPVSVRYIRLRALSEVNGNPWTTVGEIKMKLAGDLPPVADFNASATDITTGQVITFTDLTTNAPTSWSWSFPGGTPSTSTEQNPTVTYSTVGIYPVTLSVTGPAGTDVVTKNSYINVASFVPQTGWSLKYADSEETANENTPATNAFDGNNSTFWGTNWSSTNPSPPHEIQIDMGTNYNVNGFNYVPRQDNVNGRIANYEFYVSADGTNWTLTNSGTWVNDEVEKSLSFAPISARYIRLRALSEVNGNPWTTVGEIKMKLAGDLPPVADFSASATAITTGQAITFTDLTTNRPTSWSWTFTGGTPSTSTVQNPTVTYNTVGTYEVALTATNSAGNNTKIKTAYITVTDAPAYCTSQSSSFNNDYIKTVTVGATTKTSVGSTYSDYTSTVIPLVSGASTAYTLAPKGTNRTEYWRVYIDYNHNGVFTDAGELVIDVNGRTTKTGSFTVLTTAPTGQTRMRVIQKNGSAITGPCEAFANGEVEDYTVNISNNPIVLGVPSIENSKVVDVSIYSYRNDIKIDLGDKLNQGKVFIYDIMGHQVQTKEIFRGLNIIPVYNTGIYIVKVVVDNNVIIRKVIAE